MECSLPESPSEYLDALYEEYDGFDVQQTTVSIDREEFEIVAKRPDGIAVRVRVESEDGVLALPDGEDWVLPGGIVNVDPDREAVADSIEQWTGVRADIEGLERVSLMCLQCKSEEAELWTASAVFSAAATGGMPRNGVVWHDQGSPVAIPSL